MAGKKKRKPRNKIINPYRTAKNALFKAGFNYNNDMFNDKNQMKKAQYQLFNKFNTGLDLKTNAYKTINRLKKSKNVKNIDFESNVKNTMIGTVQNAYMQQLIDLPSDKQKRIKIKWIKSTSKEKREIHIKQYNKIMTLYTALKKGLGILYNCKCSYIVVTNEKLYNETVKDFKGDIEK